MSNRQQQGNNHREWCRIVSTYYINRGNKKNEKTYQLQSHGVDIVDARGVWQEQMGKKGIQTSRSWSNQTKRMYLVHSTLDQTTQTSKSRLSPVKTKAKGRSRDTVEGPLAL